MPKRSVTAILSALGLFAGISGYAIADIYDQVPGILTRQAPESPAPIPTAHALANAPSWPTHMDSNLPPLTSAQIQPLWEKLKADTSSARVGTYVIDALTSNVIFNGQGDTPMQPASTTKVLTAFTVEKTLGTQDRLATSTYLGADGAIHLAGEGDLLLGAGKSQEDAVNGHAGIAQLAAQTAAKLKQSGTGATKLIYHDKLFTGPTLETTLSEDLQKWVGHASAFAINLGHVPGGTENDYLDRPGEYVAQILAKELAAQGISVTVSASDAPYDATTGKPLARVESATLGQVIRLMLRTSDNTLAEQLCRLAGQKAGEGSDYHEAAQHVLATVKTAGVDTQGASLRDCSGLNEQNLIPPRTTAQTLLAIWKTNPALMRDLPYAWFTGTLDDRFAQSTHIPWIVAKTGSLDKSSSLAGYATTKSGRVLIFQVQVDQTKDTAWGYRPALDAFAQSLTELP